MKGLLLLLAFVGCAVVGAVLSTVITVVFWNLQIDHRAFHCTDSMWPLADYWTDIDSHASAGDTVSPGWTWEKIKIVRIIYIVAFYFLWVTSTLITFRMILRKFKRA